MHPEHFENFEHPEAFEHFEHFEDLPSPCYIIDEQVLSKNLLTIKSVQDRTHTKILLALKAFAMPRVFPQLRKVLKGVSASSLHEARLGREFGGEIHACAPAYSDADMQTLLESVDHLIFNSLSQWRHFKSQVESFEKKVTIGLRINPEYSEVKTTLYDPCQANSRLGIRSAELKHADLSGVEGFHFHTMCEQNVDALERTIEVVKAKFSQHFHILKWFNFGGGHHISRADYDIDRLCNLLNDFQSQYDLQLYLEPGEAIALNAGTLIGTVLDINKLSNNVILDLSATAHMPDVLEMPYRPEVRGSGKPREKAFTYRLGGLTCLAGDIIGEYSFDAPLHLGQRIIFEDMAHYTMVKNTSFNGVSLPAIVLQKSNAQYEVIRKFTYEDYRTRLS